jgi:pimeloyl-ACP methyl ester carboxylesterase
MLKETDLEVKASGATAEVFDELMQAFEAFKDTNDRRLSELERRMGDPLTADQLDRINARLDELGLKAARPPLGGGAIRSSAQLQHKAAFESYVRKGEAGALRHLEGMDLSGVLSRLTQPTLIVTGKLDRLVPWEQTKRIADEAPNARFVLYEDGSHVANNMPYRYRPLSADWMLEQLTGDRAGVAA